jgi:two-component system, LytTR family, sensor histidine kinase AlgZ
MLFDVCHGALVWRALLLIHGALFVGVAAHAATLGQALATAGPLAMVGLLGSSLWLASVCACKAPLQTMGVATRRASVAGLGALSSLAATALLGWITLHNPTPWQWTMGAVVGASLAAALAIWIEQRSQAVRPAHADARLAELQARIRPHFLFNTLNTATALVRADPPAAEAMLEDLSDLFRAALDRARTATLAEELAVARQYLAIEQRRFGDRMKVEWVLDARAGAAVVPSLLLQPLVENAVHHGVESMKQGAWITVRTHVMRGQAVVDIENNVGAATPSGSGMALANVRERLRLMHDVDARLNVTAGSGRHLVRITVPLEPSFKSKQPNKQAEEVVA